VSAVTPSEGPSVLSNRTWRCGEVKKLTRQPIREATMNLLSKIVHVLLSDDRTPSMYFRLVAREHNESLDHRHYHVEDKQEASSEVTPVECGRAEPAASFSPLAAADATQH
jgi:hypothetical protein